MNLRHLKVFLAVCEYMNMTKAAASLYMTQPSVSQMIAELENYYGTRLFERLKHRLYLTAAGERLQSYARHITNLEKQAKNELADLGQAGVLRIGASQTVGGYLLPDLIRRYRTQQPQVNLYTRVDNTRDIEQSLLKDRIDLGVVEGFIHSPDLVEEYICDDELAIVCAPEHPLAGRKELTMQSLAGYAFIVREPGSGTREIFANRMQAATVSWVEAGTYNNTSAIQKAATMNLGLAVLPLIAIRQDVKENRLCALKVQGLDLRRRFNLVYHRQKYFTRAMLSFKNCLDGFRDSQNSKQIA